MYKIESSEILNIALRIAKRSAQEKNSNFEINQL
jgi:hypothetical protein